MKRLAILGVSVLLTACNPSTEETSTSGSLENFDTQHLTRMGLSVEAVKPSTIEGLAEVITQQGLLYVSLDGKQLMSGHIYDISGQEPVSLSDLALNAMRAADLATITESVIEFKAPREKHVVYVFTDNTCGYCRQLHERMDEYLALGITIRYLAWPRTGLQGDGARQLRQVWCAEDQQAALAAAKQDQPVSSARCEDPVNQHFALGQKFGVRGTPAIVFESGKMLPGYVHPERLIVELEND